MVLTHGELRFLVEKSGAARTAFSNMRIYDLYIKHVQEGPSVTLAGPFIGAPHAVMGMEKLIAMGAERILVLGLCGSIQPSIEIGDLVIPTFAISEEGTSRHYPTDSENPTADAVLSQMIENRLLECRTPFTKGPIWTTDAIYRETPKKVKAYQQQNILAVEMEISAMLAVSSFRAVSMAALLVVSDELSTLKWRPGFSDDRLKKSSRVAAEVLLDVHQHLGRSDIPWRETK